MKSSIRFEEVNISLIPLLPHIKLDTPAPSCLTIQSYQPNQAKNARNIPQILYQKRRVFLQ